MDETRRQFLRLLGLSIASACAPASRSLRPGDRCATAGPFDYVVVGSGAGGGPLACNLARACRRVLLVEAGTDQPRPIPVFHAQASEDPAMSWRYFVKHYDDPARQARDPKLVPSRGGVFYPRAAALGGCTAHNALITIYPHASDWDGIAELVGDPSWSAARMRRYLERIEDCRYESRGTPGHGFGGWLSTELPDPALAIGDPKLRQALLAAAEAFARASGGGLAARWGRTVAELWETLRGDLNSADPGRDGREGLFNLPLATRGGRRAGPRDYILRTVAEGYPLTVQTGALVTRVLFEGTGESLRARGVELLPAAHLFRADPRAAVTAPAPVQVTARREVILAAGAFNTPHLLMLSGVGPADELATHGISLVRDLPGVGKNLQDRYEISVVTELPSDLEVIEKCSFDERLPDACLREWQQGRGPYTTSGAVVGIVKRSDPKLADPDLFLLGLPAHFRGYFPGYAKLLEADHHHFSWVVLKAHTRNRRGEVRLGSKEPRDPPEIHFHSFAEGGDEDVRALEAGVAFARKITATANWMKVLPGRVQAQETLPGAPVASEPQVRDYVESQAWGHHASCSCPIGRDGDPLAVLDGDFRVRGIRDLRVVDASVFPRIPGFFIALPIYLVAEKATDAILRDAPAHD
ncbi:MAG TPA: GMC oxidoreductase [Myxococcales bacterium]|nr:GMC oxidoreductase [Myxococcales bacterium]